MKVGCLGEIIFEVSDSVIRTFDNASWSGSANIQTHSRHLNNSLTEFVGVEPDKFSFDIVLSRYLGVDPLEDIERIWAYERNGIAVYLVIGSKIYGKYKWLVKDHKVGLKRYDGQGNLTSANVSLNLWEYLEE